MRDLRLILAGLRPRASDVVDDPDLGLALAPRIVRPLLRRRWCYRRPEALAIVLRACERRWERAHGAGRTKAGTKDTGDGRAGHAPSVRPVATAKAA